MQLDGSNSALSNVQHGNIARSINILYNTKQYCTTQKVILYRIFLLFTIENCDE